jgi:hypothetical protein
MTEVSMVHDNKVGTAPLLHCLRQRRSVQSFFLRFSCPTKDRSTGTIFPVQSTYMTVM